MSVKERAVAWALAIAADNTHGYDQTSRWGPDYDCSSFLISAWEQAGAGVRKAGATYTGNMKPVFLRCGFRDVTKLVDRASGAGMVRGDVLLHERDHTALHIGSGRLVQAGSNERGGITGGKTGDQTGGEIGVLNYYNYPWDCVLRYEESAAPVTEREYVVQPGDNLWTLAQNWLGSGLRYREIMELNSLSTDILQPGQVLLVPGTEDDGEEPNWCEARVPVLRRGDQSAAVESMQLLLMGNGYPLPEFGADGQWGEETDVAFRRFEQENGLSAGVCDCAAWSELIG